MIDITKKWTGHRQDWGQIHSQLEIYFEERLEGRNYKMTRFGQPLCGCPKQAFPVGVPGAHSPRGELLNDM